MIINSIFYLVFTIISHGFVGSYIQDTTTPGDFWIRMEDTSKYLYVVSFAMAFDLGVDWIILDLERAGKLEKDTEIEKMMNERKVGKINASQVYEGITEIYKDYSTRHIKSVGLIFLVCDKIKGKKDQLAFEKELQRLKSISW